MYLHNGHKSKIHNLKKKKILISAFYTVTVVQYFHVMPLQRKHILGSLSSRADLSILVTTTIKVVLTYKQCVKSYTCIQDKAKEVTVIQIFFSLFLNYFELIWNLHCILSY